jgi:hypothetical protein
LGDRSLASLPSIPKEVSIEHPGWRSPLHSIRDAIAFASNARSVQPGSFRVLDALQRHPPAEQMDILFVTATAMADSLGLDAHEMVTRAKRILGDTEGYHQNLAAARDYAKGELRR